MFTYIETKEDLIYLNQELLEKPFVGVDTEFRRTNKNNMRLALLQINDSEEIYLIDTISIDYEEGDLSFLFSNSVKKIFHSCKEDIEAIYSWTNKVMVNLFDTQIAEAFLNGTYSVSYQGLVQDRLGLKVDKRETRSNWTRRPLTDSQLHYATSDVEFLIELFQIQMNKLEDAGKLGWNNEELHFICSRFMLDDIFLDVNFSNKSKKEDKELLNKFTEIILDLAEDYEINHTFFFSKKNQKDFLRIAQGEGLEKALETITHWRSNLIKEPVSNLLKVE